jgi:hypothetical protein
MAEDCNNERLAMTRQYAAIGSVLITAGAAAGHLMKDIFGHTQFHGRSK